MPKPPHVSNRYCPNCERTGKAEMKALEWGCGDVVMIVFTFALWALLRWGLWMMEPWKCTECGTVTRDTE